MGRRCEMELCPHWGGDGNVCPCAVFDLGAKELPGMWEGSDLIGGEADTLGEDRPAVAIPPGPYTKGGRSPIVWVLLCPVCAGYAPQTAADYKGFLSGQCQGCGAHVRELHRFRAWIDSAAGCQCTGSHPQVVGEVEGGNGD